jgi:hypothetical protein
MGERSATHRFNTRMDVIDKRMDQVGLRLGRLEDRQASDFKWLLLTGLGSVSCLFATMAHGFHWF